MPTDYILYFSLLIGANVIWVLRRRQINRADMLICLLLLLTLIEEPVSYLMMKKYQNNLPSYHIYSPLEFFLISLYFNYSINFFRKRGIGYITGAIGVLFSIANTVFLQKITGINSYFLLFEGMVIIMYCLLSFHQILLDEDHLPYRFTHFWITSLLILYWGTTFTGWGVDASSDNHLFRLNEMFAHLLKAANYVFYLGLAIIFIQYRKLIPSGAHAEQ